MAPITAPRCTASRRDDLLPPPLAGEGRGGGPSTSRSRERIFAAYFRSPATLSIPALTQASSLSPPGAPEAPAAPITSLPTLIGSAPPAGVMVPGRSPPAPGGFAGVSGE